MAKRTAYLHLGLPHSGGERLAAAAHEHAASLLADGVVVPSRSVDETFRAAVELRREHKAWGLRRKDVEGVWSQVCRRAHRQSGGPARTVLVGHHLMAGATEPEIDLLVDGLAGFDLHLVVTVAAPDARLTAFPDDHDLAAVLARWERAVASPDRVHVLVCDPADPEPAWHELGRLVGFTTAERPVPAARVGDVDVHALRLLAEGTASLATQEDLAGVVEEWAKLLADRGHDVRGDLGALVARSREDAAAERRPDAVDTAALGEALADAVAEVARLRARSRELEKDNERLVRKRRRLKQRLADAVG